MSKKRNPRTGDKPGDYHFYCCQQIAEANLPEEVKGRMYEYLATEREKDAKKGVIRKCISVSLSWPGWKEWNSPRTFVVNGMVFTGEKVHNMSGWGGH